MRLFSPGRPIFEQETPHGTVEVYDRGELRELRFGNHIVQSALSLKAPDMLVLDYTRAMMAAMLFAPADARILHIGLGAGSLPRFIHRYFPESRQTVVEHNPVVIDVAYRLFGLPRSERLHVEEGDGAAVLRERGGAYDMVFLDAFHAEGADDAVQSEETLAAARQTVGAAGWVVCNVWGSQRNKLRRVTRTMGRKFRTLYAISVRVDSNVILIGGGARKPPAARELADRADVLTHDIPLDFPLLYMRLQRLSGRLTPGVGRTSVRA